MFLLFILPVVLLQHSVQALNQEDILEGLQGLKKDIVLIRRQANDIKVSLPQLTLEISEAVQRDPLVILQSEKLDIAGKHGDLVEKCKVIFNTNYKSVVDKLHVLISKKITNDLKKVDDSLNSIEKETDSFISQITSNPKADIENIIESSEVDFYAVGRLKHILPVLVQNTLYDLDHSPAADIVKDNLLKPTFDCLQKAKVTEYH